MTADGALLEALASSIADGHPIDWVQAEASASNDWQLELVRRLRAIASIDRVHRNADETEQAPDARALDAPCEPRPASHTAVKPEGPSGSGASPPPGPGAGRDRTSPEAPPLHWGHLDLRERIGAGVFGEVYRAYDRHLHRDVAVKLLKIGTRSAELLAAKVLHEGRLIARIRHPNVVMVHGVETHGDRVGLWMKLVRGRTLAEVLDRQGPFSGREAALIGQDLCRALAAVHGAGLLHRDVKAQNVIREEGGRVVLMDFGTGLLLDDRELVKSAPIAGTPLYLAPEVLAGRDAAPVSDVYSLGVLLFHLVTGTYPYAARSLADLRELQRTGERKRLYELRPDLTQAFIDVIDRALERDPRTRFQSAGALQQALSGALARESSGRDATDRQDQGAFDEALAATRPWLTRRSILIGAAGVVLAGVAAWARLSKRRPPPILPADSMVVLPFASVAREHDDLARGLAILITERLVALDHVRVVRETVDLQARDRGLAATDLMTRRSVAAALDGSVNWTGDTATVSVRVVRAGTSTVAWTRQFERPSKQSAELPAAAAREIARALAIPLSAGEEDKLGASDTASAPVFEAYLRGRARMAQFTETSNGEAIRFLRTALDQDATHAPSLAAISECYLRDAVGYHVRPVKEVAPLARDAAHRALELDDGLAAAHATVAQAKLYADWDASGAEQSHRRAIELSPSDAETRRSYAVLLAARRRLSDALQQMQLAVELEPSSTRVQTALGILCHYSRSHDRAERIFRNAVQADPASMSARHGLVTTLLATGRYADALTQIEEMQRLPNDRLLPAHRAALGLAYAGLGRQVEARTLANRLVHDDTLDGASVDAAAVFAALGDQARAFAIIGQAVTQRAPSMLFVWTDPRFDLLKGEPEFDGALARVLAEGRD